MIKDKTVPISLWGIEIYALSMQSERIEAIKAELQLLGDLTCLSPIFG